MKQSNLAERMLWLGGAFVAAIALASVAVGQDFGKSDAEKPQSADSADNASSVPTNLGEPLVDAPQTLKRLDKSSPVWLDKKNRQVVLMGSVCKANYPLEFFATYPDRGYESLVVVYTKPSIVHAALLALGAKSGKPAHYRPKFTPASGTEIQITVSWKDAEGKRHTVPAQDWIRNIKTRKALELNWVFGGSVFWKDEATGANSYIADRGDFISVASLPTAMLDLPIESATAIESRSFEGFVERLPPEGTPVTIAIKPKLEAAGKDTKTEAAGKDTKQ